MFGETSRIALIDKQKAGEKAHVCSIDSDNSKSVKN
jgi:hypothetical protein